MPAMPDWLAGVLVLLVFGGVGVGVGVGVVIASEL